MTNQPLLPELIALEPSTPSERRVFEQRHNDFVASINPGSLDKYEKRLRRYLAWLDLQPEPWVWDEPDAIAAYVRHRAESCKITTIEGDLAAISKAHQYQQTMTASAATASPISAPGVRLAVKAAEREIGTDRDKAKPLLRDDMINVLLGIDLDTNAGIRDAALLALGWAGAFRSAELANMTQPDIEFTNDGVAITLRRSKGSQTGSTTVAIHNSASRWNPVERLRTWLDVINEHYDTAPTGVWLPINKSDKLTTRQTGINTQAINKLIIRRTSAVDLDGYTSHSLRAGWINQAQTNRADLGSIQTHVRHKNVATTIGYLDANPWHNNPTQTVNL